MYTDYMEGISQELSKNLKDRIVHHRKRFIEIFKARYLEMLPSLIKYRNSEKVSVDFTKVEIALRSGYDVVIGETKKGNIQVIGYATSKKTSGNPEDLFSDGLLRHGDITFIIPDHLKLNYYKEISHHDSCESGNFIVLRNKTVNFVSDHNILNHYVSELSEIVLSRYSITMQVKITTLFLGEPGDETIGQIISEIYNGNPYIKGSDLFDPEDHIYHFKNENIAQNFQELKREYQNKISELNNMLGMNSLAVEKSSGVSDSEAKSNRAFTTSNANIYLDGRNNGLFKLNKRYNLKLEAMYNDEVVSEFQEFENKNEEKKSGDQDHGNGDSI